MFSIQMCNGIIQAEAELLLVINSVGNMPSGELDVTMGLTIFETSKESSMR